jgi:uncharacterized protein YaiI (UPF0178 family)
MLYRLSLKGCYPISRIIVDADACPKSCLRIARKLADKFNIELITVASFNHRISNENHLVVGDEAQAADIAVANLTQPGDIVITQDWGLAALILGKKAFAISPRGRIYIPEQIDLLLEERNLLAKHRNSGGRTKGPTKHSKDNDRLFESNLWKLLSPDRSIGKNC